MVEWENMKLREDKYKKTIEAYEELGKKYIQSAEKLTPKEFSGFIKLLKKGGRILDVGCAGGRDSKKFIKKGFKVIGIDLVDAFLKEARKNVPRTKFLKMDSGKLKFPKNYFDGIWAQAVLLHIKRKDVPGALKGFYRVLKPEGKLHVRVKRGKGTAYIEDKLSGGKRRIFTYFSREEMEKFIKKAGFKIITSRIFPDESGRKDVKWISIWAEK